MLRSRIIPVLLMQGRKFVKTVDFKSPKYLGDPLNIIRIFNQKLVDEIFILNISHDRFETELDYEYLERLAVECRSPVCFGGGVRSVEQVERLVGLGIEKVAFGDLLLSNPELVSSAARAVGSQSIVAIVNVTRVSSEQLRVVDLRNNSLDARTVNEFIDFCQKIGIGELVIHSIDRDGRLCGYDRSVIEQLYSDTVVPLTVLGGASSYDDLKVIVNEFPGVGVAAGSIFVLKGEMRAVLIQYPSQQELTEICEIENE